MERPGRERPSKDETANTQSLYKVKALLGVRLSIKSPPGREFLVKWHGYSSIWNSWEPEEHLHCPELIDKLLSESQVNLGAEASEGDEAKESLDSLDSGVSAKSSIYRRADYKNGIMMERFQRSLRDTRDKVLRNGDSGSFSGFEGHSSVLEHKLKRSTLRACKYFTRMMNSCGGAPIAVKNYVDFALPPIHFRCISNPIYREGVPLPEPSSLIGCQCRGGTEGSSKCCTSGSCICVGQGNRYRIVYSPTGRLLIDEGPIYECNIACACSFSDCSNRVIQRGRQVSLIIKRITTSKGWGVFAAGDIPKGTFIDRYLGEVITAVESYRRSKPAADWEVSESGRYMFDLDFNYEAGTESEFTVDAYAYGNVTHFLNHSCDPNIRVYPCFLDTQDPRLHQLAFFSSRTIKRGEELCFDYLGETGKTNGEPADSDRTLKCLCNSKKCRGYVY